uniref:Putative ovule protein n=1 Tax=Solanum chacoense TaxID=4108 RepID=A0A0V0GWJ0_SOLCH
MWKLVPSQVFCFLRYALDIPCLYLRFISLCCLNCSKYRWMCVRSSEIYAFFEDSTWVRQHFWRVQAT